MQFPALGGSLRLFALGSLLALPLACAESGPGSGNSKDPRSLRDVEIPAEFTFSTSSPLALKVSASTTFLEGEQGAVEVSRPDGRILYRGPISSQKPVDVGVVVPSKDGHVSVKIQANHRERVAQVQIQNGIATHAFR